MNFNALLRRFARNRDGSVAPMLALAALPMFGLMGAAVDFSRAASTRPAMQAALDASALMLSKDATALSAGALTQKSQDYFKTIFTRPEANNVQVSMQFTQPQAGNYLLKMTGSATVNTLFSRMLGQSSINLSTSSEVSWGIKKLNLALVHDNTGSMSQNQKMTNLK